MSNETERYSIIVFGFQFLPYSVKVVIFCSFALGSKGGAVVRGLASHQCGLGSIPGPGAICGLSLLLVLSLLREVFFFCGTPVSSSPQKPTFLNSNLIRNPTATGLPAARLLGATLVKQSWLIDLFHLFICNLSCYHVDVAVRSRGTLWRFQSGRKPVLSCSIVTRSTRPTNFAFTTNESTLKWGHQVSISN